ncbi:MAG: hypothetical protein DRI39_05970 [Chloroflexi bacterium]|nr:MAG: hypothetical protein DRI40_09650 [Chloroflexota bacterium]RLC93350.1 MAG: hypothetical protein DRI39_05970 [Chloroflexota bacterium]
MTARKKAPKRTLQPGTEAGEADFWARHSPLEFPDEIEQVEIQVKKPLKSVLAIRLDEDHLRQLRDLARHYGVGPTTLARMLIVSSINACRNASSDEPTRIPPHADSHETLSMYAGNTERTGTSEAERQ